MIDGRMDIRTSPLALAGDFWHRSFEDNRAREQLNALGRSRDLWPFWPRFHDRVNQLTDPGAPRLAGPRVQSVNLSKVVILGPDLLRRIVTTYREGSAGLVVIRQPFPLPDLSRYTPPLVDPVTSDGSANLLGPFGEFWLVPVDRAFHDYEIDPYIARPYYLLPWPDHEVIPLQLRSRLRRLSLGFDYRWRDGALVFEQDPRDHFPDGLVEVLAAEDRPVGIASNALGSGVGNGTFVLDWMRSRISPAAFVSAMADYAGLAVSRCEDEDTVVSAHPLPDRHARYGTAAGYSYAARYTHVHEAVGTTLRRGHVFGSPIDLLHAGPRGGTWWRNGGMAFPDGLPMDDMTCFRGLVLPDRQVRITRDGDDISWELDSRLVGIDQDDTLPDRFFAHVRRCTEWTGRSMVDLVEAHLGVEFFDGTSRDINPIDFVFDQFYRDTAIIVRVSEVIRGAELERMQEFVRRYRPTWMQVWMVLKPFTP